MRKTFLLSSILLLFIGVALANAPPVDVGETKTEYVIDLPGDQIDLTGIVMDVIQFPADVQTFIHTQDGRINAEILTIPEVIDTGSDLLNEFLCKLENWNDLLAQDLLTINDYEFLIQSQNDLLQMHILYRQGLSRLDIGENHTT